MKALGRLLGELVGWRWAPAVGLCVASLFYVLVVVALVPEEIGVPTTNARLATPKVASQSSEPELPTFPTSTPETEAPPVPAPVRPAAVVDFGRRGFSPPIDRPEPPPPPAPPPPPVAPVPAAPPPVPPVATAMNIPPPQPGSAGAAEQAALAAEAAAAAAQQAPSAAPPPTPPVAAMNPLQRILRGALPVPGAPSAQPAPPGAAPGAPPGVGGGPPATPPNR